MPTPVTAATHHIRGAWKTGCGYSGVPAVFWRRGETTVDLGVHATSLIVHTDSSLQALEPWPRYCNHTFGVREVTSGFWRGQTLSWRQAGRAAVGCPENGWPLEAQPVFASGPPQSLPGSCVGPIHRCIRRLCSRSYTCAWHSEDVAMFPGSMSCCSAVPPSRLDLEKHFPARRPHWPREHIVLGSWEAGDWLTGTAES